MVDEYSEEDYNIVRANGAESGTVVNTHTLEQYNASDDGVYRQMQIISNFMFFFLPNLPFPSYWNVTVRMERGVTRNSKKL